MPYVPRKYLSVSTLIQFARCPRRYFYSKCGLSSRFSSSNPLYGSAMHKAVPVALETEDLDLSVDAFKSVWDPALEEYGAEWEEAQKHKTSNKNIDKHNEKCARRSLMHFIHTHKGEKSLYKLVSGIDHTVELNEQVSDFEVGWSLDIGLDLPLVGRFDGICKHRDTGELWIWELKTTSQMTQNFFNAHEMFTQNLTYCLAGSASLGLNIQGVMLEGMHVHKDKVNNQVHPIPVSMHHLEDIMKWLKHISQALIDCEKAMTDDMDATPFMKDFTGCSPLTHYYMSGFPCEYMDLCRYPEWQSLIGMYKWSEDHNFLKQVTVEGEKT